MNRFALIFVLIASILIIAFLVYRLLGVVINRMKREKVRATISIVIIVKNSQKLLERLITNPLRNKNYVYDIIVLDLGSIDNTPEITQKLLDIYPKVKVFNIPEKTANENYFDIIKKHVVGEIVFVLDLYRISLTNPDVFVPELFSPLDKVLNMKIPKGCEGRIDGSKLLYFDKIEREKNDFVINECITEIISNIRMRMESFLGQSRTCPELIEIQVRYMLQYLDQAIKDVTLLCRLIGSADFSGKTLYDNMITIFEDYGYSHNIAITHKVVGKPKLFSEPVNNLILEIIQDLLYVILRSGIPPSIDIITDYRKKQFYLFLKYKYPNIKNQIARSKGSLSYLVVQSIHNRLAIMGGGMRIKINRKGMVRVLIHLNIDRISCQKE